MAVNKTAIWVTSILTFAGLLITGILSLPAILNAASHAPQAAAPPTQQSGGGAVSLNPEICGNEETAFVTTVMQQCKMVCPVVNSADYQPNKVCSYMWTHAGNAVTLTYPDGNTITLIETPNR
ncbi:hypothetical protein AB0K15_19010 [Amycolatopsis sp. NPDC049253]|uniref:hypothetical protein n=1 Tax=Amycolatopsis sp. NPDC049253 TaxID=3155274 RepID=UPI00341E4E39